VFFRSESGITDFLSTSEADEVEGLLALCRSDDWKGDFVTQLVTEFREGQRSAPTDVLFRMANAVDNFDLQLDGARAIISGYPAFLNPDARIAETYCSTGKNVPKDEDSGDPTKEAAIKRIIARTAALLSGEISKLRQLREPRDNATKRGHK